jgi:hypothetical protein
MKNKKTIFEVLFEKEICFAVIVSLNTFNGKGIDENSRDYFLIVHEHDLKELKNMNFKKTDDYVNVYERDLSVSEIAEFKTYMDKFVKVQHNQFGRVYELKNNSFKKLHESIVCALIKKLRTFFIISNAAFELYNSIQLSFSGHIAPSKMHQLHKMALVEIEKENPDLSLIDKLLSKMESTADKLLSETESTAEKMKPESNFPKGGVKIAANGSAMSSSRLNSNNFQNTYKNGKRHKSNKL